MANPSKQARLHNEVSLANPFPYSILAISSYLCL